MISPLSLDQLTRETWGNYDAAAMAQIAGLASDSATPRSSTKRRTLGTKCSRRTSTSPTD